ncbi:hypothetical protein MMC29_006227 [Sticta canariensis]|nr:hypothetical protein [Sticta canariensis]
MGSQRGQKLKDTCDVCSTSKVKCDKQKPTCSRCDKLGYSCFYSPARRKGRPHPPKNQGTPRSSVELGERPSEQQQRPSEQQRDAAEGEAIPIQTGLPKPAEPQHDTGANAIPEQRDQRHRHAHDTNYQRDPEPLLHHQHSSTLAGTHSSDLSSHSNAEACASIYRTDPMDIGLPHTDLMTGNLSTTNTWSTMSSYSDHSISPECSDCATVAMNELQLLTTASCQLLPLSSSSSIGSLSSQYHPDFNAHPDLDKLLATASKAIQRLSTILICPCSHQTEIGLLNAVLCSAILDFYCTILRSSTNPPKSHSSSTHVADKMDLCVAESSVRGETNELQQVTIRRVVEELPKVANLVMQFTRRYSSTFGGQASTAGLGLDDEAKGEGVAGLLLPTLAASQTTKLRSIIREATTWLAQA